MSKSATWALSLYVGGQSPQSKRAIRNLREMVERHLGDSTSEITVHDVLEQPELARKENILALPTLIREGPKPLTRVIGDLSDIDKVWTALSNV